MGRETIERLQKRYATPLVFMMTGGLEFLVEQCGGVCQGISIRSNYGDSLLVIRADFEGLAMVAFVGSATAAGCVCRAEKELRNGGLKWREDKFKKGK